MLKKNGKPKKKMGAPPVEIDLDQLAVLCRLKPVAQDVADFFKCSIDTIQRRVQSEFGLTFEEFRDQQLVHTKFSLIQQALAMAKSGNVTMSIFCLKNFCGWGDEKKPPVTPPSTSNDEIYATWEKNQSER